MRGSSLPVLVCAVLVAAGTAAVTTSLWPAASDADPARSRALAPQSESAFAALRAEIEELRRANAALRDRVAMLEDRPQPSLRAPADAVTRDELDALRALLLDARTAGVASPEAPELKATVAEVLTSIRHEEAIGKVQKAHEQQAAKLDQRVEGLAKWLELDDFQRDEVRSVLLAKDESDRELIRMWEEGVDDEVLGEAKRTSNEQFQATLGGILSPSQLETFQGRFGGGKR